MCTSTSIIFTSGRRHCTLAVTFYYLCLHLPSTRGRSNLKFMVYGHKQTDLHKYLCNAVPLVWGLLRLGPIIYINTSLCLVFHFKLVAYSLTSSYICNWVAFCFTYNKCSIEKWHFCYHTLAFSCLLQGF